MQLMHVVQDDTMWVPGYEHRTFMCSACGDIERRLVFARDIGQRHTEPVSVQTAPPISPAPTNQQDRIAASGKLEARIRKVAWQAGVGSPSIAYVTCRTGAGQHHSAFVGSI